MATPTLRILSLGAGVQSTTLLLLAAEGRLPNLDAAVFADTGWEPRAVYEHLDRVEREVARPAGIPIHRVSTGHIRNDALNPDARFASMPLYVLADNGSRGMMRRQCTAEMKLKPIKRRVRDLLGYPHPARVPDGVYAEQWIGISLDEVSRAVRAADDVRYMRNAYPLIGLPGGARGSGWSREDCLRYLRDRGFADTPKSACIGCPFHGNAAWRRLRDEQPEEWADAVDFDRRIRQGYARAIADGKPLHGTAYLHASRVPLDQAPIDRVTHAEWKNRQVDVFDAAADAEVPEQRGCSPFVCRGEDEEW